MLRSQRHLFEVASGLMKLRVLRFRSDEDRNVRICVFPQREEILIRRFGLGGVALHGIGSADLEMRESADGLVYHNSKMVEDFLELGCRLAALKPGQVRFPAHINGIERIIALIFPNSYGPAA